MSVLDFWVLEEGELDCNAAFGSVALLRKKAERTENRNQADFSLHVHEGIITLFAFLSNCDFRLMISTSRSGRWVVKCLRYD